MKRPSKHFSTLISIFIALLASTILTWWIVKQVAIAKTNQLFLSQVTTIENWISNRFELYKTIAYGLQSFWAGSEIVTAEEWNTYIENLKIEERFPSITSIAYVKRVNNSYPITFIYPSKRSTALGFNVAAEEKRLVAIEKAIDESSVTITDKIFLTADQAPGFIMFAPLYSIGNLPEDLTERRAAVEGFARIAFKSESVFKNLFEPTDPFPSLDFELYKGKVIEDEHVLYDHDESHYISRNEGTRRLETKKTIMIDNEIFTLFVVSKPSFNLSTAEKNLPNIVLASGIVITTVMFILFYKKIKYQELLNQTKA